MKIWCVVLIFIIQILAQSLSLIVFILQWQILLWLIDTITCDYDHCKLICLLVCSFDVQNGPKAAEFIQVGYIICHVFGPNIYLLIATGDAMFIMLSF